MQKVDCPAFASADTRYMVFPALLKELVQRLAVYAVYPQAPLHSYFFHQYRCFKDFIIQLQKAVVLLNVPYCTYNCKMAYVPVLCVQGFCKKINNTCARNLFRAVNAKKVRIGMKKPS